MLQNNLVSCLTIQYFLDTIIKFTFNFFPPILLVFPPESFSNSLINFMASLWTFSNSSSLSMNSDVNVLKKRWIKPSFGDLLYGIHRWLVIINCQKIINIRLTSEGEIIKSIQNGPDSDRFNWGKNPKSTGQSSD